ncbi:MAG: prepilin peptidase [Tabrizicola sp.]|jgi:prepilin signal peptidase PulO-like enzyme (type II secretory pathway)|nr:prepilin peptidase [Tabrizicola sp.]
MVVELAVIYGVTGVALSASHQDFLAALPLIPILAWISKTDLKSQTIPDPAIIMLTVFGLAHGILTRAPSLPADLFCAFGAVICLYFAGELIWRRKGVDALGVGDVKLIGAGFLVVGAPFAWLMIVLASVGGIVAAMLTARQEDHGIPFGPFLAYAIFVTFLIAGLPA